MPIKFPDIDCAQEMYRKCQLFLYISFIHPAYSTCHMTRHISFYAENVTFPVVFLHRFCTQYISYVYAGTFPACRKHHMFCADTTSTQYSTCHVTAHTSYAGNVNVIHLTRILYRVDTICPSIFPVCIGSSHFLHGSCTQYMYK